MNRFSSKIRPILSGNLFFLVILLISIIMPSFLAPFLYRTLKLSQPVALIASHFILFVIPAILYILITRQSFKKVLRLNKVSGKEIILSFVLAILAQPVMIFFSYIASFFANNDVAVMLDTLSKTPLWLMIIMIGVTPAISEEFTIRGIVLSGYRFKNKHVAALMSGFMFGILHLNMHQFLYAFAMGVIFAYVVIATNSLIPAMIAHFTINTSQLLMQRALISLQGAVSTAAETLNLENATETLKSLPMAVKIGSGVFYALLAIGAVFLIVIVIRTMENAKMKDLSRVEAERNFNESRFDLSKERIINIPLILIIVVYIGFMFISK